MRSSELPLAILALMNRSSSSAISDLHRADSAVSDVLSLAPDENAMEKRIKYNVAVFDEARTDRIEGIDVSCHGQVRASLKGPCLAQSSKLC